MKITSPVEVKNRISNMPKPPGSAAIFDLNEPDGLVKDPGKIKKAEDESPRQELLKYLNRDIHLPLLNQTKVQADSIRKLILYARLFEVSSGIITEEFLNEFFVLPKELFGELLKREEAATIFRGDFFDALRILMKGENYPKLRESILSILKHFDSYVNQKQSLQAISINSRSLLGILTRQDSQAINRQVENLEALVNSGKDGYKHITNFLKNDFIPALRVMAVNYPPMDKVQDQILSIIHYIVRYDKANPQLLEDAFMSFSEELKPLFTNLTGEDIADMKETLLKDARTAKQEAESTVPAGDKKLAGILEEGRDKTDRLGSAEKAAENEKAATRKITADDMENLRNEKTVYIKEEKDMAALLSKALDKNSPAKLSSAAQNLLLLLVQSESPMQPLMHFMIPLRFFHEDTYGEFFIDKECKERKGEAKQAANIFFTIQSDLYGTFEVDLLAKDQYIELDIKCPGEFILGVKNLKPRLRESIEGAGYRLAGYQVGEYTESKTIIRRFPELMNGRAGIDVRI